MGWASMRDRLHRLAVTTFNDGVAQFTDKTGQRPPCGVPVVIDRNLAYEGADGIFVTGQVGFTWLKQDLAGAERGDVFSIGAERFQINKLIADDGHAITAATTKL
ncbi:hypothetical protein PKB_5024 [Pseudomonas knackmussii B13]|uniref:Uncharacterized protein n=1 Tax=Pseudomonas knackmussii (strain DSM 6978 / CCUG 54928 / LMG 23759 / B13) TaxID=1301098 RepID=A0A024HP77_PSEKB|nr:hypothetical protein [Pseudomonas knackmussii]CDF86337.1 hypothetical protein PKB_5024 [Pseudomonas knackmussii B13]